MVKKIIESLNPNERELLGNAIIDFWIDKCGFIDIYEDVGEREKAYNDNPISILYADIFADDILNGTENLPAEPYTLEVWVYPDTLEIIKDVEGLRDEQRYSSINSLIRAIENSTESKIFSDWSYDFVKDFRKKIMG